MATLISVPGGQFGTPLVFKVTGTSASNFATAFQNAVVGDVPTILSNPNVTETTTPGALNEIFTDFRGSPNAGTPYALTTGGQYTFADVGTAATITGSTDGGDTVLATGAVTYDATGGNDQVTFIDGVNDYVGGTASGDTITGGAGYDMINTGTGDSTVFSGSGHTVINLNDDSTSAAPGGLVFLGDGLATVNATGFYDDVIAATNGQVIFGGTDSTSTLNVVIEDNATSFGASGDVITAGAGTTTVFDSVGGSSIFGGSGTLRFVGGTPASGVLSESIVGGTGSSYVFGASGDSITFAGDSSGSVATFLAGTGNETLNAANAEGRVNFYGSTDASSSETLVGSQTGYNYFTTGGTSIGDSVSTTGGTEAILGGTGTNVFNIADGGASAHVTIYDFAAGNDSVNFLGETSAQVQADLNAATVSNFGLTVTLSDQSTVTFVGLTSVSQLHVSGTTNT